MGVRRDTLRRSLVLLAAVAIGCRGREYAGQGPYADKLAADVPQIDLLESKLERGRVGLQTKVMFGHVHKKRIGDDRVLVFAAGAPLIPGFAGKIERLST